MNRHEKMPEHATVRGSNRPCRSTHFRNMGGIERFPGNYKRTTWEAVQEARIRAHRARVEADCERLGIRQGKSLLGCLLCPRKTVGPPGYLLNEGWEPSGDGGWLCRACAARGGAKYQG
jgi:hypothetical protein